MQEGVFGLGPKTEYLSRRNSSVKDKSRAKKRSMISQVDREKALCDMVRNLLISLCKFQSEEGRWYQVVNKGHMPDNWLENSCSCLYTAALCAAVRKGLLDKSYLENAKKGYQGVINSLTWEGDDIQIGQVCIGTGVGNYEHYIKRPVCTNDLHGVGAFLIMCAEMQAVWEE